MTMNKYAKTLGLISVLAISLTGCQAEASEVEVSAGLPVEVVSAVDEKRAVEIEYMGTVAPEDQIKYSFKSAGRLGELLVQPGDVVEEGQVIAKLDTSDLNLQLSAVAAQTQAANKDISKAQEAYNYDKDLYAKMEKLFEAGSISRDQLDQVKLKLDVSESTLMQAQNAYTAAQANHSLTNNLVDDAVITAKSSGTVLATQYEEGELIPQGYPVVVVRSETKVVQVGLSQDDVDYVDMDTAVTLEYDNMVIPAEIVELNDMPDMATRTYLAKVRTSHEDIRLGKIVDVNFAVGEERGVWVPMTAILSEGEKFVYVVEDGRAFKRIVEIENISGFDVEIDGVEPGEQIVVAGMKKLTDGIAVEATAK